MGGARAVTGTGRAGASAKGPQAGRDGEDSRAHYGDLGGTLIHASGHVCTLG